MVTEFDISVVGCEVHDANEAFGIVNEFIVQSYHLQSNQTLDVRDPVPS